MVVVAGCRDVTVIRLEGALFNVVTHNTVAIKAQIASTGKRAISVGACSFSAT
jgi:hypothetical protein